MVIAPSPPSQIAAKKNEQRQAPTAIYAGIRKSSTFLHTFASNNNSGGDTDKNSKNRNKTTGGGNIIRKSISSAFDLSDESVSLEFKQFNKHHQKDDEDDEVDHEQQQQQQQQKQQKQQVIYKFKHRDQQLKTNVKELINRFETTKTTTTTTATTSTLTKKNPTIKRIIS
jgi:hypothetical protein